MNELPNLEIPALEVNALLTMHFIEGLIYEDNPFDEVWMGLIIKKGQTRPNNIDFSFDLGQKDNGITSNLDIAGYLPGVSEDNPPLFQNLEGSMPFEDFKEMFAVLLEAAASATPEELRSDHESFLTDMWEVFGELEGTPNFLVIELAVTEDCRSITFDVCYPGMTDSKILYSSTLFFHDEEHIPELPELEESRD